MRGESRAGKKWEGAEETDVGGGCGKTEKKGHGCKQEQVPHQRGDMSMEREGEEGEEGEDDVARMGSLRIAS